MSKKSSKIADHARFKPNGSLMIATQYIKDLSFENPRAPYNFTPSKQPNVEIALDVDIRDIKENSYEVTLSIQCQTLVEQEVVFLVELKYAGIFVLEGNDVDQEDKEMVLSVHCPGILFPYARRIISDVVSDGGYSPLMLAPVDFLGMYLKRKREQQFEVANSTVN